MSLIAFATIRLHAQYKDTLVIHLEGRNRIVLVGESLEEISKYNRGDSLKNLFLEDLKNLKKDESFPATPREIYYIVNAAGKRRLKVATDASADAPFDLNNEVQNLSLNLPPLHCSIYDLCKRIEIHFYLEDTLAFGIINKYNIIDGIRELATHKEDFFKYYQYDISDKWQYKPKGRRGNSIGILLDFGAMLVGNSPTPVASIRFFVGFYDKYHVQQVRFGANLNNFIFGGISDARISISARGIMVNPYLEANLAEKGIPEWIGIEGGLFSVYTSDALVKQNLFNMGGYYASRNGTTYGFDYVFIPGDKAIFFPICYIKFRLP